MTEPLPSIWSSAWRAWVDGFQAIGRMPGPALVMFVVLPLFQLVGFGAGIGFVAASIDQGGFHFGVATAMTAVGRAVVTLLATSVLVAAASRLYRALGAALG